MHISHNFFMGVVLVGAIILLGMGAVWLVRGNVLTGVNMLIMGSVAGANYFLHRQWMRRMT